MLLDTRQSELALVRPTNSTATGTSIANPVDTLTQPTGAGVVSTGAGLSTACNALLLLPYGTATATNTFLMSVFGWDFIPLSGGQGGGSWHAYLLASFTCTLGSVTGLAGSAVAAANLYCDTIALGVGNANVSNEVVSPTGNVNAHCVVDVKGVQLVEVKFARNSSAASANALYRRL